MFFIGWLCILDRLFGFVLHVVSVYCNRSCFFFLIYYNNIIFLIFLIFKTLNKLILKKYFKFFKNTVFAAKKLAFSMNLRVFSIARCYILKKYFLLKNILK